MWPIQRLEWVLTVIPGQVVTFGNQTQLSLCHGRIRVKCAGMVCMMRGPGVVTVWHVRRHWTYGRGQESLILNLCPVWGG